MTTTNNDARDTLTDVEMQATEVASIETTLLVVSLQKLWFGVGVLLHLGIFSALLFGKSVLSLAHLLLTSFFPVKAPSLISKNLNLNFKLTQLRLIKGRENLSPNQALITYIKEKLNYFSKMEDQ